MAVVSGRCWVGISGGCGVSRTWSGVRWWCAVEVWEGVRSIECWPCLLFDILLNKYFPAG